MIRLILSLTLFLALAPGRGSAQEECDAILSLAQVQAALERIAAPGHRRVSADMELIRRMLLRFDASSINFALRSHALSSQTVRIVEFLDMAQLVSSEYAAGRRNQALNYLMTEEPRRINASAGAMLRGYPCRETSERVSTGVRQLTSSRISQLEPVTFTRTRILTTFVLSIILVLLCAVIIRRQIRRIALRNRRQKRYYVELPATLIQHAASEDTALPPAPLRVEIVDLSCEGAKAYLLSKVDAKPGNHVTLHIEDTPREAQIMWINPHYAGLKFEERLSFSDLRQLVRDHPPSGDIRQPSAAAQPKPATT